MFKSDERNTEYFVILQPRHREQSPICMRGYAKDETEASNSCFNPEWHKNVLDVKKCHDMEWNEDTVKKYWNMYGTYKEYALNEVQLF